MREIFWKQMMRMFAEMEKNDGGSGGAICTGKG